VKGNKVAMSTAGMPPIFLYRKASGAVEEIMLKGMPLGAMKNFPYTLHETELKSGDTILLLSDGLPEQKNVQGEMFDYGRVQKTFAEVGGNTPDDIIKHLVSSGDSWMNGVQQDDDITMLVIKQKV
jgi:phosphoserine phosphatase RsbU/P